MHLQKFCFFKKKAIFILSNLTLIVKRPLNVIDIRRHPDSQWFKGILSLCLMLIVPEMWFDFVENKSLAYHLRIYMQALATYRRWSSTKPDRIGIIMDIYYYSCINPIARMCWSPVDRWKRQGPRFISKLTTVFTLEIRSPWLACMLEVSQKKKWDI